MPKKVFLLDPNRFFLFALAERQHKTVQELLTGVALPITHAEFVEWAAYYNVKRSKEEQAARRAKSHNSRGRRRR